MLLNEPNPKSKIFLFLVKLGVALKNLTRFSLGNVLPHD
tara:strand:+ start:17199 stop:17315 length:117 start_codon:yes stop_codon:yes gene_type:complete